MSIAGAYAAGALIWAVPLLMLSGGPGGYWKEVAFQGGADLSGVTMLWTNPTPRQLLAAFQYAFLHPWGWWPLGGSRARLRRRRRDLAAPDGSTWPRPRSPRRSVRT